MLRRVSTVTRGSDEESACSSGSHRCELSGVNEAAQRSSSVRADSAARKSRLLSEEETIVEAELEQLGKRREQCCNYIGDASRLTESCPSQMAPTQRLEQLQQRRLVEPTVELLQLCESAQLLHLQGRQKHVETSAYQAQRSKRWQHLQRRKGHLR